MKNPVCKTIALLTAAFLLVTALGGCGRKAAAPVAPPALTDAPAMGAASTPAAQAAPAAEPAPAAQTATADESAPAAQTAPTDEPAPAGETARQPGERFETTIMIEGMEETVRYEHIVNTALGFEMDYDYESFVRSSEAERERFISVWEDPAAPWDWLELTYRPGDAASVAAELKAALSQTYDLYEEPRELTYAGACAYIEASVLRGTNNMADQLQMLYIIPAPGGCLVAAEHVTAEAAEGYGRRFGCMLDTLVLTGAPSGK